MALYDLPLVRTARLPARGARARRLRRVLGRHARRVARRRAARWSSATSVRLGGRRDHRRHLPRFRGPPHQGLVRPARGDSDDLPCIVEIAGYGGGRGLAIEHTLWPSAGYAYLFIDTRGQGSAWGSGGDTPDPVGRAGATRLHDARHPRSRTITTYRRVITDAVRAVDAAHDACRRRPRHASSSRELRRAAA